MAAKKKAAKPVAKKLAAKKIVKKSAPKLSPISKIKGKLKKPATKKLAPKKAVAKAPVKKLAPKGKPVVKPKIVLKPPKLAQKPVTQLGAKPVAKKAKAKDPTTDYRNLRKYTHLKLGELAADVTGIRATIGSDGGDAPLAAWELIDFLKASESIIPEWKQKKMPAPDGKPRKRGRPSKADLAAREGAVKPLQGNQAAAAIAKVKANAVKAGIRPAAPVVAAPKVVPGAPVVNGVKKIFKLVPKPVAATAN